MNNVIKILAITCILGLFVGCSMQTEEQRLNDINTVISGENQIIESVINNSGDEQMTESNDEITEEPTSGENTEIPEEEITVEVIPVSNANLSNTTYAWGFRRMKDAVQPEFTASYTKVLDDYEGIYVGNKDDKSIYLTFDEGYENGYTGKILDTLKEKEVTAVFFVTMPYVKQNADLVQRMIDEGHIVGNHTVNHPSMPSVTDDTKLEEEITKLHDYVKENFGGYEMTYLRPPKGEYSERTVKISKDLGYKTVLWSSAYDDWDTSKQDRLDYARKMIYNYMHNGCVMLLHAVSKDNTALLGEIIDTLRNEGYEFKSLDEFKY